MDPILEVLDVHHNTTKRMTLLVIRSCKHTDAYAYVCTREPNRKVVYKYITIQQVNVYKHAR